MRRPQGGRRVRSSEDCRISSSRSTWAFGDGLVPPMGIHVMLGHLLLDPSREVNHRQRGNVGDAELVTSDERMLTEIGIQPLEEPGDPRAPAIDKLGDGWNRAETGKAAVPEGRVRVPEYLGDRHEAVDFHVPVTRLDECFIASVCPHQRRIGPSLFDPSGDRHAFVEYRAVVENERGEQAARVDCKEVWLEVVPLRYVQLHPLTLYAFLGKENTDPARVRRYLAIV